MSGFAASFTTPRGSATRRIMTQSAGTYTLDAGWFNLDHLVVTQ